MRGRTSLIVAHRLATVERCDVVAFLEATSGIRTIWL
jgi:ABC-type multidrug transport system fused ATPase/permease subunit